MTNFITPKDTMMVIQATINFLEINLVEDNLSPSSEMERQETVERLKKLVENLTLVKGFAPKVKDTPTVTNKQPCTPVSIQNFPMVDAIRSKLKVLTKRSLAEIREDADYSGVLRKYKKQLLSKWNRRYCVLRDGILLYFQSETDAKGKGYIVLGGYKFIIPSNSNGFTFNLESYDKSTIYTFQADQKKEIDIWKEHLLKVTDQGYTEEEILAINSIIIDGNSDEINAHERSQPDDISRVASDYYGDVGPPPTEEFYGDVAAPATDEFYGDVVAPPTDGFYGDVAPPPTEDFYGDVADPEQGELYGDVATASTLPQSNFTPPYIPDIYAPDDNNYGDVEGQTLQPSEELYEELPNENLDMRTIPLKSHIQSKVPGTEFSVDCVYMGMYDCKGEDPRDLSFNRGDVMYILEKLDFNWWIGFSNGKVGLVPSNFLKIAIAS